MSEFIVGQKFSREEIHALLGGSIESYLPTVAGNVVAICVRQDMNPHAPEIILVGPGDGIEDRANMLLRQGNAVPLFLKGYVGRHEYRGEYRAVSKENDHKKVTEWSEMAGRKVLWAFYLEKSV